MTTLSLTFGLFITLSGTPLAAQHPTMPAGMSHDEHLRQMRKDDELKHRGGLAMGFNQDKTVHHFLLQGAGGEIVVTAKDAADNESIALIRSHLREIASSFASGAFDKPVATHGEQPPGAAIMAANASRLRYRYRERTNGASVIIDTDDGDTRLAVHDFLRYQIAEHKTGDPLTVQR